MTTRLAGEVSQGLIAAMVCWADELGVQTSGAHVAIGPDAVIRQGRASALPCQLRLANAPLAARHNPAPGHIRRCHGAIVA